MAASASWTYDGASTVVATCIGLTPFTAYDLVCGDPDSSVAVGTSDALGRLTLTVSDVGGLTPGQGFYGRVLLDDTGAPTYPGYVSCLVLLYGSPADNDESVSTVWSWSGTSGPTGTISARFLTVPGQEYAFFTLDGSLGGATITGDGTVMTLSDTTNIAKPLNFFIEVIDPDTFVSFTDRIFDNTTPGDGYNGITPSPPPPVPAPNKHCRNSSVRFLVTDLTTVPTTWLDTLSLGATLTYNLLQPATIDIPFRSNDPRVNSIFTDGDPLVAQSNRLVYAFFREGGSPAWKCRGAGIAMSPQDQADADVPVTHMVFYDPWQYLLGRPCFADTAGGVIGSDGLLFPATEMGVIAATLLKNTIESEGVGCFIDAGPSYGGTAYWSGTIETTPVVDYTVQQGTMVGDAWNQIVALEDPSGGTNLGGCDIVLTPIYDPVNRPGYTHELSIFNLAGDDLYISPAAWGEFVRSASTADRQHDGTPGQFVNVADFHVGQGGYPVPIGGPPPDNAASVALYRPYWESKFFPQQVSAASVLALAQQELQLRKQGKRTFTVDLDPVRSGVPIRDYNIGDRIELNAPAALRVAATGRQRIQTIPVDVNPDGMTRVQGLLTSPDWRGM